MNQAFIQNRKYEIDRDQGRQDQKRLRFQRILKRLRIALECRNQSIRDIQPLFQFVDGSKACPNATPGARLNERVIAGNIP